MGSLGEHEFQAGYYAYCGSAMGGFKPRLLRHISKKKTPRWHVDYLTNRGSITTIAIFESKDRLECTLAAVLGQQATAIAGFGCSDCDCISHLFFAQHEEEIAAAVEKTLAEVQAPSTVLTRRDIARYLGLSRR